MKKSIILLIFFTSLTFSQVKDCGIVDLQVAVYNYTKVNLLEISKNKTTIIVSHRVSSAKNADSIIILNEGQILQQGTHNQLINQEGYYRSLYLKQIAEKELS